MIPLDIFHKKMHNKPIETELEAWLTFLSDDNPESIIELITEYPEFKAMYETLYLMCQNTERVMGMFSEQLSQKNAQLSKQAEEIEKLKKELEQLRKGE